jgi:G3E family GTPase
MEITTKGFSFEAERKNKVEATRARKRAQLEARWAREKEERRIKNETHLREMPRETLLSLNFSKVLEDYRDGVKGAKKNARDGLTGWGYEGDLVRRTVSRNCEPRLLACDGNGRWENAGSEFYFTDDQPNAEEIYEFIRQVIKAMERNPTEFEGTVSIAIDGRVDYNAVYKCGHKDYEPGEDVECQDLWNSATGWTWKK